MYREFGIYLSSVSTVVTLDGLGGGKAAVGGCSGVVVNEPHSVLPVLERKTGDEENWNIVMNDGDSYQSCALILCSCQCCALALCSHQCCALDLCSLCDEMNEAGAVCQRKYYEVNKKSAG